MGTEREGRAKEQPARQLGRTTGRRIDEINGSLPWTPRCYCIFKWEFEVIDSDLN